MYTSPLTLLAALVSVLLVASACVDAGLIGHLTRLGDLISPHTGRSPLPVIASFNVTQFTGRLFEAWSDLAVHGTFEKNGACVFADYALFSPNNGSVSVYNSMRVGGAEGPLRDITGHAEADSSGIPGHLTVQLYGGAPFPAPYWIISTGPVVDDKYDYVIVTESLRVTLWVLVRDLDRYFSLYDEDVRKQLRHLGFTHFWNKPMRTNHTACTYERPHTGSPRHTELKEIQEETDLLSFF